MLVDTEATRTRASATWSSSAATCASAVQMPWPYSTLPTRIVTSPSRLKSSHRASTGLAARSAGSGEALDRMPDSATGGPDEPDGGAGTGPSPAGVPPAGTLVGARLAGSCPAGASEATAGTTACPPGGRPAASTTARAIRPCARQRHRLPSRASRTSCPVGAGWSRSSHQHARGAVTALGSLFVDERLLDRMELTVARQAFHGGDGATACRYRQVARRAGAALDQHEARSAKPYPAAELRPGQPQVMAEHIEQWRIRLAGHAALRAVHGQPESGFRHGFLPNAGLAHVLQWRDSFSKLPG